MKKDYKKSIWNSKIIYSNEEILEKVKFRINFLKYVPKTTLNDKNFVIKLISINGLALKYVSKRLRNDKEVVMIAVKNSSGFALKYASDKLKADKEVVQESIKRWKMPLEYASKDLQDQFNSKIDEYYKKHKI